MGNESGRRSCAEKCAQVREREGNERRAWTTLLAKEEGVGSARQVNGLGRAEEVYRRTKRVVIPLHDSTRPGTKQRERERDRGGVLSNNKRITNKSSVAELGPPLEGNALALGRKLEDWTSTQIPKLGQLGPNHSPPPPTLSFVSS